MAIRKIVTKEDKILLKKSRPVEKFDERLWQLLDDMKETMYLANGVGHAAVQVGILRRAVVLDCSTDKSGYIELINPEIIETEGEQLEVEGCLSFPGENGVVKRPASVKIKAQDRHGKWCVFKGTELKARCFCHEIDHLDGITFDQKVIKEIGSEE